MAKRSILTVLLLTLFHSAASADVITLNDIPLDFRFQNLPSYDEGGFNVSASCTNCSNVFSTAEAASGYPASTNAAGWGADGRFLETWNTSVIFTLSAISGDLFDLLSFDMGWFNNATTNANWSVRAFDANSNLIADDDYVGIGTQITSYTDVLKIEFQSNGGFSSFDNLVVNVPTPSALALFGIGLFGLGMTRRRNQAQR